jgi:hypothetical protein
LGEEAFTSLAGGSLAELTVAVVQAKRSELKSSLKAVSDFVDQYVAHSDRSPAPFALTFNDVRTALVSAFRVLRWLSSLIDAAGVMSPVPVIPSNWLKDFRVPWLKPDQQVPAYVHLDDLVKKTPSR